MDVMGVRQIRAVSETAVSVFALVLCSVSCISVQGTRTSCGSTSTPSQHSTIVSIEGQSVGPFHLLIERDIRGKLRTDCITSRRPNGPIYDAYGADSRIRRIAAFGPNIAPTITDVRHVTPTSEIRLLPKPAVTVHCRVFILDPPFPESARRAVSAMLTASALAADQSLGVKFEWALFNATDSSLRGINEFRCNPSASTIRGSVADDGRSLDIFVAHTVHPKKGGSGRTTGVVCRRDQSDRLVAVASRGDDTLLIHELVHAIGRVRHVGSPSAPSAESSVAAGTGHAVQRLMKAHGVPGWFVSAPTILAMHVGHESRYLASRFGGFRGEDEAWNKFKFGIDPWRLAYTPVVHPRHPGHRTSFDEMTRVRLLAYDALRADSPIHDGVPTSLRNHFDNRADLFPYLRRSVTAGARFRHHKRQSHVANSGFHVTSRDSRVAGYVRDILEMSAEEFVERAWEDSATSILEWAFITLSEIARSDDSGEDAITATSDIESVLKSSPTELADRLSGLLIHQHK